MKRIVLICSVLILQGLNSFADTNAVPPAARLLTAPERPAQKAAPAAKTAGAPAGGSASHSAEIPPAQLAAIRRISREGLLTPPGNNRTMGAMLEGVFHSRNNDVMVIIFPTGR